MRKIAMLVTVLGLLISMSMPSPARAQSNFVVRILPSPGLQGEANLFWHEFPWGEAGLSQIAIEIDGVVQPWNIGAGSAWVAIPNGAQSVRVVRTGDVAKASMSRISDVCGWVLDAAAGFIFGLNCRLYTPTVMKPA